MTPSSKKPNDKAPKVEGEAHEGRFERLFANRRFSIVFSLLAAVALWMVVVTLQPNTDVDIRGVRVNWDYGTGSYSLQGLDVVETPERTVTLRVNGDGSLISQLNAGDFIVYPNYSTVTGAGTYTLRLEARLDTASGISSNVNILSVTPDTVEVTFEEVSSRTVPIEVDISGLETPAEYYVDAPSVSPASVTVSGPTSEVERIERVVAQPVLADRQYTESLLAMAPLTYLDANGEALDATQLSADVEQVEVSVNIYKTKEVPLRIEYTGVPSDYDTEQLHASLSRDTIRIAGAADVVDQVTEISAGYADLSKFELGSAQQLTVQMPEGLINVDNVQTVEVRFNTTDFDTRTVTVSNISPINTPRNVRVTVTSTEINGVQLVGERAELEELNPASLVAQVDLTGIQPQSGQVRVPVTILAPGADSVFATGSYSVLCIAESAQ